MQYAADIPLLGQSRSMGKGAVLLMNASVGQSASVAVSDQCYNTSRLGGSPMLLLIDSRNYKTGRQVR